SLDLIVRTPKQIERGLRDDDWFLREVIEKGKVLYEARDGQVGPQGRSGSGRGPATRRSHAAAARSGVLPLSAGGGEVSQGAAARTRRRRTKGARPGGSSRPASAP